MRKNYLYLLVVVSIALSCTNKQQGRVITNFDENWLFANHDIPDISKANFDDSQWDKINVPHDGTIDDTVSEKNASGVAHGFFSNGITWYRKHFKKTDDWKNKKVFLLFDGVYMNSNVYLNKKPLGFQSYGYAPFYYDITDALENSNTLLVRVDNSKTPNDRWYPGAGIYRHVWVIAVNNIHIPQWGTYVTTPQISNNEATVSVVTKVNNTNPEEQEIKLISEIVNNKGDVLTSIESTEKIPANTIFEVNQKMRVEQPIRWTLENPFLYKLVSRIISYDEEKDKYETIFGIREVKFNTDSGFLLNGKKTILKGVCIHHDLGSFGAAINTRAIERRLEILKSIGVNAIRLSHNPHAPELLDLCDKMGLLVFDEAYDKWEEKWDRWGYKGGTVSFLDTWKNDLTNFIDRDKNHPSVIIWSVGNETMEQLDKPKAGNGILKMLVHHVHIMDPSRDVTCALHPGDGSKNCEFPSRYIYNMDVVSYNYHSKDFEQFHTKYPNMIFVSSETKACREEALKDYNKYDFITNSWFDMKNYSCGQFIWIGIDYYGESKSWPERGNKSGLINTCGFRKPQSYFTESMYSEKPMVAMAIQNDSIANLLNHFDHWMLTWMEAPISRHWNWEKKKGESLVYVFSNCEKVKLILNGVSLGEKKPAEFKDKVARFDIDWKAGTLIAIGINQTKEISFDTLQSANTPAKIELIADRKNIAADGVDISNIEVRITDEQGVVCPFAKNKIQFNVSGVGKIAGVDNGNMSDHFNLKGTSVSAHEGKCLLIIQSKKEKGEIVITAKTVGFANAVLKINAN